ncbi:BolA/IbaG family iron-sulfur metabolism protein [Pseudohongiella sp. SYSU M77423]|uniref:BolA family protein n=1 Tax=unclassified Pseudohongiella TaxID=2629611 RepID=UPI001F3FC412|nr:MULTISPECIES: BolA/IbaG family iron-sulfur metabolism protein [unclassified Pseudohongiella]MDH7944605.1 BolA/IbaG family iron-sulfur metabolism protein [Pseudohongiella sp. SYSU M77423]
MSLDAQYISELLSAALPDCQITVDGGAGKFQVIAVGDVFSGLGAVKRQQLVYQHLNPHIQSGAVHAVTMRLMTPAEAAAA